MRFRTKKIKTLASLCLLFVFGILLFHFLPVHAQGADVFGLDPVGENIGLGTADIRLTIARIIRVALGLLGIVAVSLMLYGGFMYMTAGGEEDKVATGKKIIINGAIGLVIILSSFAIASFVINQLAKATGANTIGFGPCGDAAYAFNNPEICNPIDWGNWCQENPDASFCCEKQLNKQKVFIAKSITPVTDHTGMNNVSVRVLFNAPLKSGQEAESALVISDANGQLNAGFDFQFLVNSRRENVGVEARYSNPDKKCSDGTACMDAGEYKVNVSENLIGVFDGVESQITTSTSCGNYPLNASFVVDTTGVRDQIAPEMTEIRVNGVSGNNIKLRSGRIYTIQTNITDDSGFGFAKMTVRRETLSNPDSVVVYTDLIGPTITRTSDTDEKPFSFVYPGIAAGTVDTMQKYTVTIQAWDIDHNSRTQSVEIIALPDHCFNGIQDRDETSVDSGGSCGLAPDDPCTSNWQCDSGVCAFGRCVASPVILDVSPMDGAAGNWISILGKYFGTTGTVQFGIGTDDWVGAQVVNCAGRNAWNSNYIVAEVPADVSLPVGSTSSIKVSALHSLDPYSSTTPDLSGSNNTGKKNGVIGTANGMVGGAFVFDGSSYVETSLASAFNTNRPLTLAGSYNFTQLPAQGQSMYLNNFLRYKDGKIFFGESENYFDLNSQWSTGDWKAIVFSYNEDHASARLYVNGEVFTPTIVSTTDFVPVNKIVIGGSMGEVGSFVGMVDRVKLFSKFFETDDAAEYFGFSNNTDSLVLYWEFDSEGNSYFSDTTVDQKGPKPNGDGLFLKNSKVRPGICTIKNLMPSSADNTGRPGDNVRAEGILFGQNPGKLSFGGTKGLDGYLAGGVAAAITGGNSGWTGTQISARVPDNMSSANIVVYAESANREKSNGVPFLLTNNNTNLTPIIESIDPSTTTPLSFLTIRGRGFGSSGNVFVNQNISSLASCFTDSGASTPGCYALDTTLPEYCGTNWGNFEVVVQVPADLVNNTEQKSFYVGLKNNFGRVTQEKVILGVDGTASSSPSICKIQPNFGPAPLPVESAGLNVYGINLANISAGYFYSASTTWLMAARGENGIFSVEDTHIKTFIPSENGRSMRTGPIKFSANGLVSNGLNYTVTDCREKDAESPYGDGYHCCQTGPEAGVWKDDMFTCEGETRTGGYVWRFTTGRIPNLPRVMEVCDVKAWSVTSTEDFTAQFPSPTPWEAWEDGRRTCLNAQVALRFNMGMQDASVNNENVKMFLCGDNDGAIDCGRCGVTDGVLACSGSASTTELMGLSPELQSGGAGDTLLIRDATKDVGNLLPQRWYRVILTDRVMSREMVSNPFGGLLPRSEKLLKTRPCGNGTAYCYDFKTGLPDDLCILKNAAITPPEYVSSLLGILQDKRGALVSGQLFSAPPVVPSYFHIWGLANQQCTTLNVDGLEWVWGGEEPAKVNAVVAPSDRYKDSRGYAIAYQNTGAGGKKIHAETEIVTDTITGDKSVFKPLSNIVVDLGDPRVIDFWPKCTDACVNATVGVTFNQQMDSAAYSDSVVVSQCADEFCLSKNQLSSIGVDEALSDSMTIALTLNSGQVFATNTWYLVEVASSGLRAVIGYGEDGQVEYGKGMAEPFVFKFRTKKESSPCIVSRVSVEPSTHISFIVGEKTVYVASPFSSPDQCSDFGQKLDPWSYSWDWQSSDNLVASFGVDILKSGGSVRPYCTKNCLLSGSVLSGASYGVASPLCGNARLDAGEDCDIAIGGEVAGVSCSLNCVRPGNANISSDVGGCGDGVVSPLLGEDCDTAIVTNTPYCDQYCRWKGVTRVKPFEQEVSWCGSGSVTIGEECDIEDSDTKVGCTQNCLHGGTPLALDWCLDNIDFSIGDQTVRDITKNCTTAFSVCGNGELELGEQCELTSPNSMIFADGVVSQVSVDQAKDICNSKCQVRNLCNISTVSKLKCQKGLFGCKDDCTLAGSSIMAENPSFCGDGIVGAGEWSGCEPVAEIADLGGNPVQVVTSVGESEITNPLTKQQEAVLSAEAIGLRSGNSIRSLLGNEKRKGDAQYAVQCGFAENNNTNNCPNNLDQLNNYGVGKNSCCYERPRRVAEYPVDGAGIVNGDPVCPNTYVEVAFAGAIDEKTIDGSILIARAIDTSTDITTACMDFGETDVTDLVKVTMGEPRTGMLGRVWNYVHGKAIAFINIFRSLFGMPVLASMMDMKTDKIWCSGSIVAEKNVQYVYDDVGGAVAHTIVGIYPKTLFEKNSYYAVILRGGSEGMKDVRGVGLRNKDFPTMDDSFVFATGNNVCKIKNVVVSPSQYYFNVPYSSTTLSLEIIAQNSQQIVSIPGVYDWEFDWNPKKNNLIDVPVLGGVTDAPDIVIAARNVEGQMGLAGMVKVVTDIDPTNNQTGKYFASGAKLFVNFCENPWPILKYYPFEDGVSFGGTMNRSGFVDGFFNGSALPTVGGDFFNFSLKYCADAGESGNIVDDLPYFKPYLFVKESFLDGYKKCSLSEKTCTTDLDCNGGSYSIPGFGDVTLPAGKKGICRSGADVSLLGGNVVPCTSVQDCGPVNENLLDKWTPSFGINSLSGKIIADSKMIYSELAHPSSDKHISILMQNKNIKQPEGIKYDSVRDLDFDVDGRGNLVIVTVDGVVRLYNLHMDSGEVMSSGTAQLLAGSDYQSNNYTPKFVRFIDGGDRIFTLFQQNQEGGVLGTRYLVSIAQVAGGKVVDVEYPSILDLGEVAISDIVVHGSYFFMLDTLANKIIASRISNVGEDGKEEFGYVLDEYVVEKNLPAGLDAKKIRIVDGSLVVLLRSDGESKFSVYDIDTQNSKSPLTLKKEGVTFRPINDFRISGNKIYGLLNDVGGNQLVILGRWDTQFETDVLETLYQFSIGIANKSTQFDIFGDKVFVPGGAKLDYVNVINLGLMDSARSTCDVSISQYGDVCREVSPGQSLITKSVQKDVLRRILMFNDRNDDAVGIQILKNPDHLSAAEWYTKKFPGTSGVKAFTLAGYSGVSDEFSYYVNALNISRTGNVWSNIYSFSLNPGAQENTKKAFEAMVNSIQFNINLSDFGSCLKAEVPDYGGMMLYSDNDLAMIADVPCVSDLDCRDRATGFPLADTNGICSNEQTKLFRDLNQTLPSIRSIQAKLYDYHEANNGSRPKLESGTYLPGYTVSKWPSWGLLGRDLGGLPMSPLNEWAGCNADDTTTCWNVANSTFSCPEYSNVFEYKYFEDSDDYMLYGRLEYFTPDSVIVANQINTDYFNNAPSCAGSLIGLAGNVCGDRVVNPATEDCDPPGSVINSNVGFVAEKLGTCNEVVPARSCVSSTDCQYLLVNGRTSPGAGVQSYKINHSVFDRACNYNGNLIGVLDEQSLVASVFPCFTDDDCRTANNFDIEGAVEITSGEPFDFSNVYDEAGGLVMDGLVCGTIEGTGDETGNKGNGVNECRDYVNVTTSTCGPGSTASRFCKSDCRYEYTMCKPVYVCSNGKVEGDEVCDDGALNGNYGKCAIGCKGFTAAKCRNGQIDYDGNGKPLEKCEFTELQNASSLFVSVKLANKYSWQAGCSSVLPTVNAAPYMEAQDKFVRVDSEGNRPGTVVLMGQAKYNNIDGDSFSNHPQHQTRDNCPKNSTNENVADCDSDTDFDGDSVPDVDDNCPITSNQDQKDTDLDGFGDVCDPCINSTKQVSGNIVDPDGDQYCGVGADVEVEGIAVSPGDFSPKDNCPDAYNPSQSDINQDGVGDACATQLEKILVYLYSGTLDTVRNKRDSVCQSAVGRCEKIPSYACRNDADCKDVLDPNETPKLENWPVSLFDPILSAFINLSTDDSIGVVDGGKCLPFITPYNLKKENSCSWDCQNFGQYCGDGQIQKEYEEECDDGNNTNGDGCGSECKIDDGSPDYDTDIFVDEEDRNRCGNGIIETYVGENGVKTVELCDESLNNGKVCSPSYNKSCVYCSSDCTKIFTKDSPMFCGNGKRDFDDKNGNGVRDDDEKYFEECDYSGVVTNAVTSTAVGGPYLRCSDKGYVQCVNGCKLDPRCVTCGPKQGGAIPKISFLNIVTGSDRPFLSDGDFTTYVTLNPAPIVPGSQPASPSSGVSSGASGDQSIVEKMYYCEQWLDVSRGSLMCDFCKIAYANDPGKCSNLCPSGISEEDYYCEQKLNDGEYKNQICKPLTDEMKQNPTVTKFFKDQPQYYCPVNESAIKTLVRSENQQAAWEIADEEDGDDPTSGSGSAINSRIFEQYVRFGYAKKLDFILNFDGFQKTATGTSQVVVNGQSGPIISLGGVGNMKIESDRLCSGVLNNDLWSLEKSYWFTFGDISRNSLGLTNIKHRMFKYDVSDEKVDNEGVLLNEYVYSPPVEKGQIRVVIRWTEKNKNVRFVGIWQNDDINDGKQIGYMDFLNQMGSVDTCKSMNFLSDGCRFFGSKEGIYVHPLASSTNKTIYTQAFTIVPTSKNPSLQEKYRFFVDAIASPIFPFQNEDVRVEVYQHKTGSISRVNMYEPDRVFEIRKSSGTSTNVSAQYWHVFNLVENTKTQKFEIVPVEKIRTDYTQVLNDT